MPEARVALAPGALRGEVALRRLEVDAPTLELIAGTAATDEKVEVPPLEVQSLAIRNATLSWRDRETGTLLLEDLAARGSVGSGVLDIEAPRLTWSGETRVDLGPARARLTVSRALDVVLDDADLRVGPSALRAWGPLLRQGETSMGLDFEAEVDLASIGERLGQPQLGGTVELSGRVEGPADAPRVVLDARGSAASGPWVAEDLGVHVETEPLAGQVRAQLRGRALGGSFEGDLAVEDRRVSGRLHGGPLDLARLPPEVRPSLAAEVTEAELRWEGPLEGPVGVELVAQGRARHSSATARLDIRAQGHVDPEDGANLAWSAAVRGKTSTADVVAVALDAQGRVRGVWPPDVSGKIEGTVNAEDGLPEDEMTLAGTFRAGGEGMAARLETSGPLDMDVEVQTRGERIERLSGRVEQVDLARLGTGLSGVARVELEGTGPVRNPELAARVSVRGLEWEGAVLGPLEVSAEGTIERAEWRAALPDLSIGASGEVERSGDGPRVRGQAELRETPLGILGRLAGFGDPPDGRVTATLDADVPLSSWADTEATLDVSALEVSHLERELRASPFRVELRERRAAVRDLHVEGSGVDLDLDASAGLEEGDPIEVRAWLEGDMGVLPMPEGWSLAGQVNGAVAVTGTATRPALEGALYAGGVTLEGPQTPKIQIDGVELVLGDQRLRVSPFDARVGDAGRAHLEGEVPYAALWPALRQGGLAPSESARLALTWDRVAYGPFEEGLAGELTLEGGLAALEELTGEVRLPAQRLVLEGLALELQPTTLRLQEGRVTTTGLTVRSPPGNLEVNGVVDLGQESLDLRAGGTFALDLLSAFVKGGSIEGRAEVELSLTGPLTAPVPRGSVTVRGMSVRARGFPQAITGIEARVEVEGETAVVGGAGELGGGTLQLEGEAAAAGAALGDLWLQLTGRGLAVRYPPGLRSRLDLDLTLAGRPDDLMLAGTVGVQGGVLDLDTAVREALRARAPSTATASEGLRAVALDVTVDLNRPVALQSSFGRLEATGRITARGDLLEPAPFGRLDVRRGGRLELQGRDLTVTGGTLSYRGSWSGDLSLNGETVVPNVEFTDGSRRDLRVRATLQGTVDQPSLVLSSDPSLSRQEIVSAIATGRLQSSLVDSSAWLLGGQAATLVSGQLTGRLAQSFGLDEITIRPDLVARETDPSARFTFGKRLGEPLALIYSAGLGGPETRYAELRGYPGLNVQLRALRRDSGTHELGFGQRFEFGGGSPNEPAMPRAEPLRDVRFEGAPLDEELRRTVRLAAGQRVPDWRVQQEAERLRTRLRRRGHLDAEVSARIDGAAAVFKVEPGPLYTWRVEGMADPPGLERVMGQALFEADAVDRGRERLLRVLSERGHLQATVESTTKETENGRVIVFAAVPGPRLDPVTVRFPGAEAVSPNELLAAAGGARRLLAEPEEAVAAIEEAYRARYFLAARVSAPRVQKRNGGVVFTVPIDEGPPATLKWVRAEGTTLPEAALAEALSMPADVPFSAELVTTAVARVRDVYLSRGYAEVRIRPEPVAEGNDLGLALHVREGEPRRIQSIHLEGNRHTSDWLVRRALDLETGEPLDPRRLGEAERRLLELGTFSRSAIVPDQKDPGVLTVDLEEAARFTATYDVRWEQESGWSGLVDGLAGNVLGLGIGLGGRVRYGEQLREFRGSLNLPTALATGDVTGTVSRTEEDIPAEDVDIVRRQTGFQLQYSIGRASRLRTFLGYRYRRNLTIAPTLPEIPIDVGGLDVSLLRTTQDDLLDPRRGAFWSLNLDLAPSWLGSDAPLLSAYAQTVFSRSFFDESFTWAQSYRLGLAWGLDGEPVIAAERFRAGGPSSLRGFGTNEVGPRGFFGEPSGGEAVVIVNQELRYRHRSGLGLVGFYDVGNVFPTVDSMSLDLRHTLGAGLRWASPIGLLRLDVGFPVDRRPEEKGYQLFFGVGQAF